MKEMVVIYRIIPVTCFQQKYLGNCVETNGSQLYRLNVTIFFYTCPYSPLYGVDPHSRG